MLNNKLLVEPPIWKICSSKWVHLPQGSGWKLKKNYLKPPQQHHNNQQTTTTFNSAPPDPPKHDRVATSVAVGRLDRCFRPWPFHYSIVGLVTFPTFPKGHVLPSQKGHQEKLLWLSLQLGLGQSFCWSIWVWGVVLVPLGKDFDD